MTIRMMQTAEIPTTGMSGMDRNHLPTTANIFFRFCSEFGFQSFPCAKTVNSFTLEDDRNIFSRVMESHQKNDAANGKMLYYLSENLRYPKDLTHLLYASQVLQGMAIKYGVNHWRRNRGRCMGTLYWQINDNWPAPSWFSIDYFGRWKAPALHGSEILCPTRGQYDAGRSQVPRIFFQRILRNHRVFSHPVHS